MFESLRVLIAVSGGLALAGSLVAPVGYAEPMADPTTPPPAALAPKTPAADPDRGQPPLQLSAIFFSGGRRIAIIDGQRVQESDTIGGAEILEIAPTTATILKDEEIVRLELVAGHVKQTPHRSSIRTRSDRRSPHGAQP